MEESKLQKYVLQGQEQSIESWSDAEYLISGQRYSLGLFAAHLALEKILKALVYQNTRNTPPRIHNLMRLAELTGASLDSEQRLILGEMNQFQIEGRYLDMVVPPIRQTDAQWYMTRAKQVFEWLTKQLSNQ
jgi:HEPN domain-containing protein